MFKMVSFRNLVMVGRGGQTSVKREACPHRKSIMIILVVGMYSLPPRQLFIRICACFQPCEHTHTRTHDHTHALLVCMCTYIHECMYVCTYVYTYERLRVHSAHCRICNVERRKNKRQVQVEVKVLGNYCGLQM